MYRKSKKDKIVRILNIIRKMMKGDFIYSQKLARDFSVSLRTIQRDIKIIREVLGNDFIQPHLVKTKNATLNKLLIGLIKLIDRNFKFQDNDTFKVITVAPRYRGKDRISYINTISEAFKMARYVSIRYKHPLTNNITDIDVVPVGVIYSDGYLYLLAKKENDVNPRTFRFDRIMDIKISEKVVVLTNGDVKEVLENCRYSIWSIRSEKPIISIKLVAKEWASDFFENFEVMAEQKVSKDKNGKVIVEGRVSNFNEITPYILRFIPHVKVIKPKDLKEIVLNHIKEYLSAYEK